MRAQTKDGKFVKTDGDSEQVADMSKVIAFGIPKYLLISIAY